MRPVAALALALGLLTTTGCVQRLPDASPAAPVSLTFAFWALNPAETALFQRLIADFEHTHPRVTVTVLEIPNRYYDKLQTMFGAGTPPDVMVVNYGRAGDLARRGVLADLAPFMAQAGTLDGELLPVADEHFRGIGAAVGRPGLYALPQDWNPTNLLLYDRDVFDAAGLPYPYEGWTWDDFAAACHKLTVRSRDPRRQRYGAAVCLYPYAATAWLWQAGGDVLSPDGRASFLAAPANVRALQFLRGLVEEGVMARPVAGEDRSVEDFQSGRVAMAFVTPYALSTLRKPGGPRRWGLAPPLVGVRRGTGCIPTGLAMAQSCAQPQAAWELIRYLVTQGAQERARAALGVPAWQPALRGPALAEGFGADAAAVLRQAVATARPHPLSPTLSYERMSGALREALEQVFGADMAPARALQAAQERLNREAAAGQ